MMHTATTIDCQDCGRVLHVLDAAQAQAVAANPYNFVSLCSPCGRDRSADSEVDSDAE